MIKTKIRYICELVLYLQHVWREKNLIGNVYIGVGMANMQLHAHEGNHCNEMVKTLAKHIRQITMSLLHPVSNKFHKTQRIEHKKYIVQHPEHQHSIHSEHVSKTKCHTIAWELI